MAKQIKTVVKLQIPAGKATPAPPVGTALGPHGLNLGEFVSRFNTGTQDRKDEIVPVEVTIRNIVAGGMAKMLGLEEGIVLSTPVLEYHYKNDALGDPLMNDYHIRAINLASDKEMELIKKYSFEVNRILSNFFDGKKLDLVDFKLEFGRHRNEILLGDEISPDTCRLWEKGTKVKLDKDRFRRDLGNVEEAYQEVLRRVVG